MKKTLALVLAFALVFSTMTVAFAEDTAVGADAKVCTDLGMLVGDGSGVTPAYLATAPKRITAAVMVLRLKGLEADAKAFTGTDNFADADKAAWAKPIMAYLKANPQLGWAGDGKNFDPEGVMTAQAYYKVMLETLGYKQNTATVVGDFTWEKVLEFAAAKGLAKAAAATNFTVNDLAVATVETLKASVKDTTKTLAATLVEAGKVDKAKAVAAGVYVDSAASTAKLSAVKSVANDKVRVEFDADATKEYAENLANYKIVVKGSTTALEVKAAAVVNTTVVELTTAAQTAGTAYTMTVADVNANFTGLAKDSGAPEVDTITCLDTNLVEVSFTKILDRASAEDVANYTLNNGAVVKKAELWEDNWDNRKYVKLTTEGVAKNKVYKLKVANVKSADLVAIKTVEKSFAGVTDTTAAKVLGNVVVKNNQRLWVKIDDLHGVDKASAENLANWSIDGIKINSAVAKDYPDDQSFGLDDYGYLDYVELNTEPMDANHKYTLTINNLVDGSTSKNAISKAITKTFYGVAADKSGPKVGAISPLGDSMIEIQFSDNNRIDQTTATDINNYTFNEGLKVLSAKILRASKADDPSGKLVVLTTTTMDEDTTYKLTIANVADEFGNVMTKVSNRNLPRTQGADIQPPVVSKVVWADDETVKLYFNERLDIDSANDPVNYSISGDLGKVLDATISGTSGYTRVDLTTAKMAKNKNYTVTVTGVKDRLGNEMSEYKAYFTAGMTSDDTDRPVVDNISSENEREIRVTFDEPVKMSLDPTKRAVLSYGIDTDNDGTANTVLTASAVGAFGTADDTAYDYIYTLDEGTTVTFLATADLTNGEYVVEGMTNVKDVAGNSYVNDSDDKPTFYGNTDDNEEPTIDSIDQVDQRTLKVYFNEPILLTGRVSHLVSGAYTYDVDVDGEGTNDALSTLTIERSSNFVYNTDYTFDFDSGLVTDYSGLAAKNDPDDATTTTYTALLNDEDDPYIDYVEAVNVKKIKIVYNEDMQGTTGKMGSYEIYDSEGDKVSVGITPARDADDHKIIYLNLSTGLDSGDVYTVVPKTSAYDIAGNGSEYKDIDFDFVASGVLVTNYIKGVKIVNSSQIVVTATATIDTAAVVTVYRKGDTAASAAVKQIAYTTGDATADKDVVVDLTEAMRDGIFYEVRVLGNSTTLANYAFEGVAGDGGIDVDTNNVITFSGWDATNFVVKLVYDVDNDGQIVSEEVYYVQPTYNVTSRVYEFVLDTIYNYDDETMSVDFATAIAHGEKYEIQVFRTTSEIDMPEIVDDNDYNNAIKAVIDGAPLYSQEFEK